MSILKTFRNFKVSIFIILLLLSILTLSILNTNCDFQKMQIIEKIQEQTQSILKFDLDGGQTSQQLLKGHHHYMNVNYEKIKDLRDQDIIKNFYIKHSASDQAFTKMGSSLSSLHALSINYYQAGDASFEKEVHMAQNKLISASKTYSETIVQNMALKNNLILYIALANIIHVTLIFLWYSRKLTVIYRDIKNVLSIDEEDRNKSFKTEEFTAIKRRMERRPLAGGGKNLLDPLTELLNEKGLANEYAQRNSGSSKESVCVTILDIDNFKELKQNHDKAFSDGVIKKLAFIMNLEKKPSDTIGRTGEDQFIIITSRENQNDAFKTIENIRQSIEKTLFKSSIGKFSVTVSGGFVAKDKHEKIESTIATARALVKRAKVKGKNSITRQTGFNEEQNLRM